MRRVGWGLALVMFQGFALAAPATAQGKPSTPSHRPKIASRGAMPDEGVRLNNLGVAYMNQGRLQQALDLFQRARALDARLFAARLNTGIALLNLQRFDAATSALLDAVKRNPNSARGWYNLGLLYRALGNSDRALESFQHAAQLDPKDPDTQYFLGFLYTQKQEYAKAVAAYQRTLELNPFHPSAEFGLARAYQRMANSAEAQRHMARFQHLNEQKLGAPISQVYGEQGQYSLAERVVTGAQAVPPPIAVRFASVGQQAGLPPAVSKEPGQSGIAAFLGAGACFLDMDNDGLPDLFLPNAGAGKAALFRNLSGGRFANVTASAGLALDGAALGCTAGDYDNDGLVDLAASFADRVLLFRNRGKGKFRDVTAAAGIRSEGFPLGLTFVDYDHDGDLDLYIARFLNFPFKPGEPFAFPFDAGAGNMLWRNNGDGTFTEVTAATGLAGDAPSVGAVVTDFNNDRAVDLVVTGWRKSPMIFANPREGKFRAEEPWAQAMPSPTAGVAVLDFNKDGWMDLAFTHWGAPGLSLWRNVEGKRFEPVQLPIKGWTRAWGVVAFDYDNDGWIDIAAVGESEKGAEVRLFRNRGAKGFTDVSAAVGLDRIKLENPRALIAADFDRDFDTDLLVTQSSGPVVLLRNEGGNRNTALRVSLKGLADNKSAIGTKVEVFAGELWQKWEVPGSSGYLGQSATEVIAGLRRAKQAEVVRLLWPTGVLQDEVELAAGRPHAINEIDRRGSSCPILFAWGGSRYEFVADVIGAGIVGHWVAPGERNVPDPTEYIKLDGARVRPRNGLLSFRFGEPMEEANFLDQVRLLAADHPKEFEVYPNERFLSNPPFPDFKVIASRGARPPAGAWDDAGHDVLPQLLHRDKDYVTGLKILPFAGFAEPHRLELDLGEVQASKPLRLLLHGFIEYFSASSMYAAHQAGLEPVAPYVEALDASGRWVRVVNDMGFPAGLPRTIVADLTGRLPAGSKRIRITTNLQIYWDQILVDRTEGDAPARLTEVPLANATLAFRGYPRQVEGKIRGDLTYAYDEVSLTGPFAHEAGNYTRFGDVRNLLTSADDRFVIFGSGEEIALDFDPATLPSLPEGWTRDYLFFADGFVKDMDFYEADFLTVEPVPFHGMRAYPYAQGAKYPDADGFLDYYLEYNTRSVTGKPASSLRFSYAR